MATFSNKLTSSPSAPLQAPVLFARASDPHFLVYAGSDLLALMAICYAHIVQYCHQPAVLLVRYRNIVPQVDL